jgi:hypothetical protein
LKDEYDSSLDLELSKIGSDAMMTDMRPVKNIMGWMLSPKAVEAPPS